MNSMSDLRSNGPRWLSRYWILGVAGAAGLALLIYQHQAHAYEVLPWLLVLACPLMHLFGHRGHGAHGHRHGEHRADSER